MYRGLCVGLFLGSDQKVLASPHRLYGTRPESRNSHGVILDLLV